MTTPTTTPDEVQETPKPLIGVSLSKKFLKEQREKKKEEKAKKAFGGKRITTPEENAQNAKKQLEIRRSLEPGDTLTGRQRKFLEAWVSNGGVVSQALKTAKYSPAAFSSGKTLLHSPEGQLYIEHIKKKGFIEATLSVEEIVNMARKTYTAAMEEKEFKSAIEAVRLLAQYKGMLIDRKESNTNTTVSAHVSGEGINDVRLDVERFKNIIKSVASGDESAINNSLSSPSLPIIDVTPINKKND
jgi:phage terminase small subunit